METSNGRAVNVIRQLNRSKARKKSRKSPYKGRKKVTRPYVAGLPEDKVGQCLQAVELALHRANREEAIAAIDRAFVLERRNEITVDSHFEELGIRDGLIDTLNLHNVYTIRDLILLDTVGVRALKGVEEADADTIILAVESRGFRFFNAEDDE